MRLRDTEFYTYYRPAECELRVYLKDKGEQEAPPSPYEDVIKRLGERHEKSHLASLPPGADLSSLPFGERVALTAEAIQRKIPVVYQPAFLATTKIGGQTCEIVGEPDFLILADDGRYLIRDSKISRRITEEDHPEIPLQLGIYGWLFEEATGEPPAALQVHSGTGEIVNVEYDGGTAAMAALGRIVEVRQAAAQPYSPVGWSKCGTCGFKGTCWTEAENRRDVALLVGVDQGLAKELRRRSVVTVDDLLASFTETTLAEVQKPHGQKTQRVGKRAASIMLMARAYATGKEILIQTPAVPQHDNYVMFDLEGLPPQLDDLGKIYLWGMKVFGTQPSEYNPSLAGFGDEGDRRGWNEFLAKADEILTKYGDIPFIHWGSYEKTHLDDYTRRCGDPSGIAARVRKNLLDLLPIAQRSIALPLPSYSLKVIEKYVGFERTQEEYGGDWSMAKYIEATETADESPRSQVIAKILKYNEEDLSATHAVLGWLISKAS